jgi:hypothetical protein
MEAGQGCRKVAGRLQVDRVVEEGVKRMRSCLGQMETSSPLLSAPSLDHPRHRLARASDNTC